MSKWILPYLRGPETMPLTTTVRNKFVSGTPASLKNSVIVIFCQLDPTVGATVIKLENLNAVREIQISGRQGPSG